MPALTSYRVGILMKHFVLMVYNNKCEKMPIFHCIWDLRNYIKSKANNRIPRVGNGRVVIRLWYVVHISNVITIKTYHNFKMYIFWSNFMVTMVTMATNVMANMTKSYSFLTLGSRLPIWHRHLMIYLQ